ncbi:MAG: hypothetical protein Q8O61_11150, partial [Nocardioides sp.]|nr:hypothetical protein [Nocardioides sp.]
LAATPMWTGHAMFNVKDVPVATGYTVATLSLLLFVRSDPVGVRLRVARAAGLVAGLVLALGTRPGMWPGLLAALVVAAAGILLGSTTRRGTGFALAEVVASCATAACVLIAVYPRLFGSPLRSLPGTSESSSSFFGGAKSDRLYVPRHLAQEVPTLLLVFAVTGAVLAAAVLWQQRRADPVLAARVALVGVQALALPVVAIVLGSDLYHGLRQLLFAIPAVAVLSAYGMAWWVDRSGTRVGRVLALAATAAALALPTVDQVTLQPYQTTYVSLAADLLSGPGRSPDQRLGADYWRVSLPELVDEAALDRHLLCKAVTDRESGMAHPFTNAGEAFSTSRSLDCREEPNGPLAPEQLPVVRDVPVTEYDAVFIDALPTNCTRLGDVTRWRHGFEVVLSTLGRCALDPAVLDEEGVRVDDPALGTAHHDDLWRFAVDGWEQWPGQPALSSPVPLAELAFRLAPDCAGGGCTLVITGTAPADLVATVSGAEVPVRRTAGTLRVPVAPQLARDSVWVTLTRRSAGTLGVRLTELRLEVTPAERRAERVTKGQR